MATRQTLREEVVRRLGDPALIVWDTAELNGFIDNSIKTLYPIYWLSKVGITTATDGPIQIAPSEAIGKHIYYLGFQRTGANKTRPLHGWVAGEADGQVIVPKLTLEGMTLLWGWTEGFNGPDSDTEVLTIPKESEEVVVLRTQVLALERLLSSRTHFEEYQVLLAAREGVTENDIVGTINSLRTSITVLEGRAVPRPERRQV